MYMKSRNQKNQRPESSAGRSRGSARQPLLSVCSKINHRKRCSFVGPDIKLSYPWGDGLSCKFGELSNRKNDSLNSATTARAWPELYLVNINNSESVQLLCHLHEIGATAIHVWHEVIKLECKQLSLGERFMELNGIIV